MEMKRDMLAEAPKNSSLRALLNGLRSYVQPLNQDNDLKTMIEAAQFEDRKSVGKQMKKNWHQIAIPLAEALHEGGVEVDVFRNTLRAFKEKVKGQTPAEKLKTFQQLGQPFPSSKLNYDQLKNAVSNKTALNAFLQHFIHHQPTETQPMP
jgi:hypothetical protein